MRGVEDAADGGVGDLQRDEAEGEADNGGGQGFEFAVAVGMIFVAGFGGEAQADEDGEIGGEVRERVDGVGDEGLDRKSVV